MFFMRPAVGMFVLDDRGTRIAHRGRSKGRVPSWEWDADFVRVTRPSSEGPPDGFTLVYPRATERSRALNREWSNSATDAAFVRTEVQQGQSSRAGLLLPAPGVASWRLTLPKAAELHFNPGLVPPEILDGSSDGAVLVVEVEAAGQVTEIKRLSLSLGEYPALRMDLSRWSEKEVRLRLRTLPVGTSDYDYAFIGEPAVVSRSADPRRVVLIFVDTLRPDHLSLYGYERQTSPTLDLWAGDAAVFEQARSVAPWTLPSARTMLTGRQPEYYGSSQTLPGRFSEAGYATAMFAGNVYLGANFDIHRDWGLHQNSKWPPADEQVDSALDWLARQDGRDALLMVHFMDAHLPYTEPRSHRTLFAGDAVEPLGEEFHRSQVPKRPTPEQAQYVRDRYDNNIRFIDDEMRRLFAAASNDSDVVLVLADHGEEFWEHSGYEHGHTLYDELLRVPLVLKAPGVEGSRVTEPVSLLDVTPTLLDAAGLDWTGLDGTSLLAAAGGDDSAKRQLAERDQAFGRPLYGRSRWGVLHDGQKYLTIEGREQLFDLDKDDVEQVNLLKGKPNVDAEPWRKRTGQALGRDVAAGYRIVLHGSRQPLGDPVTLTVAVPGGVRAAWEGHDPLQRSTASVAVAGDSFTATWLPGTSNAREVFFAPKAPLSELTHALEFVVAHRGKTETLCIAGLQPAEPGRSRAPLRTAKVAARQLQITWGVFPNRDSTADVIDATDDENIAAMEALGYVHREDEAEEVQVELVPCGSKAP